MPILPAIESGSIAAEVIAAGKPFSEYPDLLAARLGDPSHWTAGVGRRIPPRMIAALAPRLLATRWFARGVVLDRWFLHSNH